MKKPTLFDACVLGVGVLALAGWIAYNAVAYDDWTCAFARCVKVSGVKP